MSQVVANMAGVGSTSVEVASEGLKVFLDFAKEHPREAVVLTGIAGITIIAWAYLRGRSA